MANINNRVKLWRGTRARYNALGTWDYWTEYNVKEDNGTWTKYYGTKEVVGDSGELAPVEGVLSPAEFNSLDSSGKTQGSRWLVGSGDSYYVFEFGPNASVEAVKIQPFGSYSVRVKNQGLKAYELVNGELYTYDVEFSSGNTPSTGQTLDEINFEEENSVVRGYVILDNELDENSPHAITNSAITSVIYENEEIVAAALNDLNDRVNTIANTNISGEGVISVTGNFGSGYTISHDNADVSSSAASETLVSEGTFRAISEISEDSYGHVTAITATTYTLPASITNVSATGDTYVSISVANGSAITIATNEAASLDDNTASGMVADSKAVVDYVKSKIENIKNVTTIGGVAVPTSASTYTVESGNTLIDIQTAADGASGIKTTISPVTGATSSSTVGLVINTDVKSYIDDILTSVMHYKGVADSLPATAETGDVYIVGTQFTISGETAEVGDYIVYHDPEGWSIIEKNDTGAVTSTGLTSGAMVLADGTHALVSAGTVGNTNTPIYLNAGVPTAIDAPESGTTELVYGSAVTLATVQGLDIIAELPELDTELNSGSTNGVQNSAITRVILENEEAVAAALNDLNDGINDLSSALTNNYYDKGEVDNLISASTAVVVNCGATITTAVTTLATVDGTAITTNIGVSDCGATIDVNDSGSTVVATVAGQNITAKVGMQTLKIAGANGLANGVEFDGTTPIEILVLDCGEY